MRFLNENKVLSDAQSGFRPSDSCDYQLLSIVYDIYKSLHCGPPLEVWRIFLDISKALTEFGMMGWYIKLSHLEVLAGDLFWVLCFSWCMLMILAVDYHQQPNVLLMIHHFFQWSMMSAIFQWIKWWSWENFNFGLPRENVL